MDCKQVTKYIPAFIDEDMAVRDLEQFLLHIEHCPECREELTIQILVADGLNRLESGDDFDIMQEMERKIQRAKRKIKWHKDMEFLAFAIGFVLLCIIILLLIWLVL